VQQKWYDFWPRAGRTGPDGKWDALGHFMDMGQSGSLEAYGSTRNGHVKVAKNGRVPWYKYLVLMMIYDKCAVFCAVLPRWLKFRQLMLRA
jgi:hypothetical protein